MSKPAFETQYADHEWMGRNDAPLEMVSFGSCELDGYLYLHGGHKGKAHTYSKLHHENEFFRIKELSGRAGRGKIRKNRQKYQ